MWKHFDLYSWKAYFRLLPKITAAVCKTSTAEEILLKNVSQSLAGFSSVPLTFIFRDNTREEQSREETVAFVN